MRQYSTRDGSVQGISSPTACGDTHHGSGDPPPPLPVRRVLRI